MFCLLTEKAGRVLSTLFGIVLLLGASLGVAQDTKPKAKFSAAQLEHFEKKIRPLLVAKCFKCHSKSAKRLEGGLHLDTLGQALKGGDTGPAIMPGNAGKSLLIQAIRYNGDYKMPPQGKLSAAEISLLENWVKDGAPWTASAAAGDTSREFDLNKRRAEHWCWKPIRQHATPQVKNKAWPLDPIDNFVLAKLEAKGLTPAKPAERRILIRRVYFDLIGLPPAPEIVAAFVADKSDKAYERVVDELLRSPQFGERWARHWLDLVRYAESRGHEFDYHAPNAYLYRDYVIRALNADLPYDQFVKEHLAGDLLAKPRMSDDGKSNESIIGSGFWFLGDWCHSPVDIRKEELDRQDNMVDVFGKAFLAMTISCARCHDHKFDAIAQRDYYGMLGYLQSTGYRLARVDTMQHHQTLSQAMWKLRRKESRKLVDLITPSAVNELVTLLADEKRAKLNKSALQKIAYALLTYDAVRASTNKEVVIDYGAMQSWQWLPDGVAFGDRPVRAGEIQLTGKTLSAAHYSAARTDGAFSGLRLAKGAQNDAGRIGSWVRAGRSLRTPTFEVTQGVVHYLVRGGGHVFAAVDSHHMINGPLHGEVIKAWKDAGGKLQWVSQNLNRYKGHRIHLEFTAQNGKSLEVVRVVQGGKAPALTLPGDISKLAIEPHLPRLKRLAKELQSYTRAKNSGKVTKPLSRDGQILRSVLVEQRDLFSNDELRRKTTEHLAKFDQDFAKLAAQVRNESRVAMATWEGTAESEHIFIRGNHKKFGKLAPRQLLTAIVGDGKTFQGNGSGRLELAQQMVADDNPLTARVMANRVWHHLFGRGIVPSVDNFGVLGELPSHSELLDQLAWDFRRDKWSVKRLIRRIVLTQTYRMDSAATTDPKQLDPGNVLLHRMRIRRLQGEVIRDSMLSVSGRLQSDVGGPSVPVYLTPFMTGRGRPRGGPLDGSGRRSIYVSIRRNFLSPMMLAFDMPQPFSAMGRRTVSNVPAQALILMNDPFVLDQANKWAARLLAGPGRTTEQRIGEIYETAFSRLPSKSELDAAKAFLAEQGMRHGVGEDKIASSQPVWADFCHVMFNVKEFIYIR